MARFWLLLPLLVPAVFAQDAADLFATRIQPVLVQECQGCHGASMTLSKLDVRSRESLLRGGARGPAGVHRRV